MVVHVGALVVLLLVAGTGTRALAAGPAALAAARADQCALCHRGIDDAHPKKPLACTTCHRGNATATDAKRAHVGMLQNPSDLRVAEQTCGACHAAIVKKVKSSIMAHRSGTQSGTLFPNGLQPTKEGVRFSMAPVRVGRLEPLPTFKESGDVFFDLLRKECTSCHLWTQAKAVRGNFRATGCAACHMPYAEDGKSLSRDVAMKPEKPGRPLRHQLTKKIPVTQCATCHNGGSRAAMSFRGMMEAPPEGRQTFLWDQDLLHGHAYSQQTPDVHFTRGMACIDCHTEREVHGDGRIYPKRHYEVELRCETCHGTPDRLATGITAQGRKVRNLFLPSGANPTGLVTLMSKVTGKLHVVPQLAALPTQPPGHEPTHLAKTECFTCHTAWAPTCYGCHIKMDYTAYRNPVDVAFDHLGQQYAKQGWFRLTAGVRFADPEPVLGLNWRGKLVPFVPRAQPLFTYVNPAGETEYAFRKLGFAHNPIVPHTVVRASRTCESCHGNPRALGLGLYTSREHPKLEEFGQPRDFRWDRIVDEVGVALQVTTVEGARPLNREEMARIGSAPYKLRGATALVTPARAAQPLTALDPFGIYADGFGDVRGIVVDGQGNVFVADRAVGTVTRIAPDRTRALVASGLERPIGLALDPAGRLLIAEEKAGRVVRVEANGRRTAIVSGVKQPRWLAALDDGTLFISARQLTHDSDSDADDESAEPEMILELTPAGQLRVFVDGLRSLQGLVANHATLLAATQGRRGDAHVDGVVFQIAILPDGSAGAPVRVGPSDQYTKPVGLGRDRLGALYLTTRELDLLADHSKRAVAKLHPSGVVTLYAQSFEKPQGVAFDADGNLYVADGLSGRVLRFSAPPALTLVIPAYTNKSPLIVTGTTLAGARVELFVNDAATPVTVVADAAGAFTASVTLTLNASNTVEAFATSHGGQGLTSPAAEATVVHDSVGAAVTFSEPLANAYVRGTVTVTAQATDPNKVASLALSAGTQALSPALAPPPPASPLTATAAWTTLGLADGTHTLAATASDQAGNTTTAVRTAIVDNTPPHTVITGGPSGEISVGTATFTFTATDNLTPVANLQFAWRLDGGPWSAFGPATTTTFANLTEGGHTFQVKAIDLAGNEDPMPGRATFTVSFGPAITSVEPASATVGALVTITGTTFEPGATQVSFNGLTAVIRTITATSITTTVPIGAATGLLTVTTSRGSASRAFTVQATGDFTLTAAPATARVIAGDQTSVSITVGGSGSFTSLVSLALSPPPGGVTTSFSPSALVAPGSSTFTTLAVASGVAPGTYTFTVTGQARVDGRSVTRTAAFALQVLAPETPAVTGRVLTAEAVPQRIPGATVTLGSAFTLTDAGGNFVLLAAPAGPNMLLVDGRTASTPTAQYPPVEVNIAVNASGATRVPFVVYLPKLDTAHPIDLPLDGAGFTTQAVQATTPLIAGLAVTVPTGTRIIGLDGNAVSQLTITPVPVDRSPMPFPPGITAPMLFSIQPGGAVPSQPLPITFPNVQDAPAGSKADLYFFDIATGGWEVWGTGTVSADGARIVSDPGFGLPRFAWHFAFSGVALSDQLRTLEALRATGGEPVDLPTGRFVVQKTDLVLPGRIPGTIQRIYRSENPVSGLFGVGWTLDPYDTVLTTAGTSLSLILPDQSTNIFAPSGPGQWRNTQQTFLRGAVLTQLPGDFQFQIRFKDGTVHRFARTGGFANLAGLVAITDRSGNTVTVTRGPGVQDRRILQITEPAGRALTLAYDAQGRITSVTDPIGRVVQYAYDVQGRLSTVTDPAGGITRYTYDASHRVLTITDPRNITFLTNEYDGNGRVVRQTQADGSVLTFAYELSGALVTATTVTDPVGNPTRYRFNGLGFTLSQTDALGQTTSFEYDNASNLLQAVTDALGRTRRVEYDALGNLTRAIDPAGNATTFTYDPSFSAVTSVTNPLGNTIRFERDAKGNVTGVVDAAGARTGIVSDALGQPVSVTDPLGDATTYAYDALGNPTTITDPLGRATVLGWDLVSRILARTDARGRTTRFGYDPLNRLVALQDPAGGTASVTYDGNGNLVTITDALGRTTTHTHDVMDRLLTRAYPLGGMERYDYDIAGNLARYTDRNSHVVAYDYDALRRRIAATHGDGTTTRLTYDAAGHALEIADSAAGAIRYEYDLLDRLLTQTGALGTVAYAYDALDRRTLLTTPGMAPVSYEYDANSRLTRVRQGSRTVELQYDASGRRTSLTLPNGVATDYQYDGASRLTGITYRIPGGVLGTLTYAFDRAGHLTVLGGTLARTSLPSPIGSAAYDAENRQLAFGDTSLAYDGNGNPTLLSGPTGATTLEWDGRNRLVRLTGPALSASFLYDAVGRRIAKTINDVTTRFLYDGPDIAQEIVNGVATAYLRLPFVDAPVARGDGAYYLTDHLGSILGLTDAAGALTTRYVYDPFGLATAEGAASDNPLQFTGRETDRTGLLYFRARYYAPALHRFLGPDLLPGLGANRYAYVGNNPLGAIDPFGLETFIINGGSASSGPGGSSAGANPVNRGLTEIANRLEPREQVVAMLNSGQTDEAFERACNLKKSGHPVFIIGHSWGGEKALRVARRLVEDCGIAPDHVFTIDPFSAPDVKAPPGVPVTNFYQRRSWWFGAPEVEGAVANILVRDAYHSNITQNDIVKRTIEQTIVESRGIGQPLGGRY